MTEIYKKHKIVCNKIMCRNCGEIIESTHRHDYKTCSCGRCSVDGGHNYLRRCCKTREDFIEMSEIILVDEESNETK